MWDVEERAKTAGERPRTNVLAKHRPYHKNYRAERPLPDEITATVKSAACSGRVESLSHPKSRKEDQFRQALWEVSASDGLRRNTG